MESSGSLRRRLRARVYVAAFRDRRRIGWFAAALAVFLLTLLSPLNALADGYLFSAHMAAAHPAFAHRAGIAVAQPAALALAWRGAATSRASAVGWLAGVGAMWFWHAPALCNAAVTSRPVHALQIVSLLGSGAVLAADPRAAREERLSPPGAVLYLFSACVTCSVLGIIITFSPVTVCSIYTMPPSDRLGMWKRSARLGFLAGTGPANRRSAHVGAHVFDLFQRDLRPNCALVRQRQPRPGNERKCNGNQNTEQRTQAGSRSRTNIFHAPPISRPDWRWERPSIFWGLITSWVIFARRCRPFHRRAGRMDHRNSP